jgi:hypothetical protein
MRIDTFESIQLSFILNRLLQVGNTVLGRDPNRKNDIFILEYAT